MANSKARPAASARPTSTVVRALLASSFVMACAAPVCAEERTSLGRSVVIAPGEVVDDVVAVGGSARIEGRAEGDVVTLGGRVVVLGVVEGDVAATGGGVVVRGRVEGDVSATGGDIIVEGVVEGDVSTFGRIHVGPNGRIEGDRTGAIRSLAVGAQSTGPAPPGTGSVGAAPPGTESVGALGGVVRRLGFFSLLFLLALGVRGLLPGRSRRAHAAMVGRPVRAFALGAWSLLAGAVSAGVLIATVVGAPLGLVLGLAACLLGYIGLSLGAWVLGAVLPFPALQGRPRAQLAAGCALLLTCSLLGASWVSVIVAFIGVGGLVLTHLERAAEPRAMGAGPYRSAAA